MRVGILGSGTVGQTLGAGFARHGHETILGTRDPGKADLAAWARETRGATVATFEQAAARGELLVLACLGTAAEAVVLLARPENFAGKTLIDATNPLSDAPPVDGVLSFFTGPNESLGERIQARLPAAHVVKAFNSVGSALMVDPRLEQGTPTMFFCGDDAGAKEQVAAVIRAFGWEPYDCGGIRGARALEPLCLLWCLPGMLRNEWRHAFKLLTE